MLPFLRHVFRLPDLTVENVKVVDPSQHAEYKGEKHPVVDVTVSTPSGTVHLEMQYAPYSHMHKRLVYYHCHIFARQLAEGQRYDKLERTISLLINHKKIITEEKSFFNRYFYKNEISGNVFSDISEIDVLELEKIPEETDGTPEWMWGKLIDAEKEDDFEMLATGYPELSGAISVLEKLSADKELRILADAAEIAQMDEVAFLEDAELRGETNKAVKIAIKMIKAGKPASEVSEWTDLPLDVIHRLVMQYG